MAFARTTTTMTTLHPSFESVNPLELEAQADEHDALAATLRARAKRQRLAAPAQESVLRLEPEPHMARLEYARRSGISGATVSRYVDEGMPVVPVGTTYRIEPGAADAWRVARSKSPTKAKPKRIADDVDVSSAAAAGLRVARSSA